MDSDDCIVSIDLASDVKKLLDCNPDVKCKDNVIKDKIMSSGNDVLLIIKKIITSPTTIISANVVDKKFTDNIL